MIRKLQLTALAVGLSVFFAGCVTMPTPPSQITGTYTSDIKYEGFDCSKLYVELDSLTRREGRLAVAQEQWRKKSLRQAFWTGYGPPDGIEAHRLAKVRGEIEAVRRALEVKKCYGPATAATVPQTEVSGRRIIGYRSFKGMRDARGNPVFIPIYADEQKK